MAYNGPLQVIQFTPPEVFISVASAGMDISVDPTTTDNAAIIVPVNLMLYAFGVYVSEDLAASAVGSVFLERSTNVAGTDTEVIELDLDSTAHSSGNGTLPLITASTGSEDIDAGDVLFAPSSSFPILIEAPQVLTVRYAQSSGITGELTAFIVCRWQAMDARGSKFWSDVN